MARTTSRRETRPSPLTSNCAFLSRRSTALAMSFTSRIETLPSPLTSAQRLDGRRVGCGATVGVRGTTVALRGGRVAVTAGGVEVRAGRVAAAVGVRGARVAVLTTGGVAVRAGVVAEAVGVETVAISNVAGVQVASTVVRGAQEPSSLMRSSYRFTSRKLRTRLDAGGSSETVASA